MTEQNQAARAARQKLSAMTPAELAAWLARHQAALEEFCSYAQAYVIRRAQRGIETLTDRRYRQFLAEASDLLAGLQELRELAGEAAEGEKE